MRPKVTGKWNFRDASLSIRNYSSNRHYNCSLQSREICRDFWQGMICPCCRSLKKRKWSLDLLLDFHHSNVRLFKKKLQTPHPPKKIERKYLRRFYLLIQYNKIFASNRIGWICCFRGIHIRWIKVGLWAVHDGIVVNYNVIETE